MMKNKCTMERYMQRTLHYKKKLKYIIVCKGYKVDISKKRKRLKQRKTLFQKRWLNERIKCLKRL